MIIGMLGFAGAGKGTVGDYIRDNYGFKTISYASTLKDVTATLFSWDRMLLEGDTVESRQFREKVDEYWSRKLNIPNLTPRLALQLMGTEAIRKGIADNMWIAIVEKLFDDHPLSNFIITDCRFPNEIESIKKYNGKLMRVKRGDEPAWYNQAIQYNKFLKGQLAKEPPKPTAHISEWAWIGEPLHTSISNDGTLEELYMKINSAMNYWGLEPR